MKRQDRYGARSVRKDFPSEAACLEFIFDARHSKGCSCGGTYRPIKDRKQYQCSKCRFQIAPTAGTIFHKSDTPLTLWFQAILAFSNAKSGLSAKELEREIETTYKTAWRMLTLIRRSLKQGNDKLKGIVEMDASYFGGRRFAGRNNERLKEAKGDKSVVMGAIARGGEARIRVVEDASSKTHRHFLLEHIERGSRLMTDGANVYEQAHGFGYKRQSVSHRKREYVRGNAHVNTLESFWAHVKRSIAGTHKTISKKYLQSYLDGFVFHRNNSYSDKERFAVLLGTVLLAAR